jgi:predicted nucleic acid-binding protein
VKVVDASVFIEVLIGSAVGDRALAFLNDDLYAPDLLMPEVLNYFRKAVRRGDVPAGHAKRCVDTFVRADVEYCPTWPYTQRVWDLRDNLTSYDACYIALAEDLGCPLLTTDERLANASNLPVNVLVV